VSCAHRSASCSSFLLQPHGESRSVSPARPEHEHGTAYNYMVFGDLVEWLLTDAGLRLLRQTTLMARGEYRALAPKSEIVYCPSINY
jgi:hypothetical protein